jgi:hypothetical protein
MIRQKQTPSAAPARRRIAIMEIPQVTRARLGAIHDGDPSAWPRPQLANWNQPSISPINNQVPANDARWQAHVLYSQAQKRETTPGHFSFSPLQAPHYAPPLQAHWNSWGGGNCDRSGIPTEPAPLVPVPAAASVAAQAVYGASTLQGLGAAPAAGPAIASPTLWTIAAVLGAGASLVVLANYRRK